MEIKKFDDLRMVPADEEGKPPYNSGDISDIEGTITEATLETLEFNERTTWPSYIWDYKNNPKEILNIGITPPFNVKQLHSRGITGYGVNVAIIDHPLDLNHPEYKDKIVKHKVFGLEQDAASSYHGPAVTSLLVGNNIGTAPGAKVYYCAEPSWRDDAQYETKALEWIIEENKTLAETEKIKVVSISAVPTDRSKNGGMWLPMVEKALENNILVLDCNREIGFIEACSSEIKDYNNIETYFPGFLTYKKEKRVKNKICAPVSHRTIAEVYDDGVFSYSHSANGGHSWAIPYVAGVCALMWQIDSTIDAIEMRELLLNKKINGNELNIINPINLVNYVENKVNKKRHHIS